MSDPKTDARAIIETALASATPHELDPAKRYAVVTAEQGVETIEPVDERTLDAPRRVRGTYAVSDVDSLKVLFDKYAYDRSEVFADDVRHSFTVVLNAHEGSVTGLGFGDHRIGLQLRHTPAWLAWSAIDGKYLAQSEFAEFVEDRLLDIEHPSNGDVMDLAQHFEATTSADFKSGQRLDDGTRVFRFEETVSAKAGQSGQLEVPKEFVLALAPFEGADPYRVRARFRYRLREGKLALGIKLERPEDVIREAFADVVGKVQEATARQVIKGTTTAALA